MRTSEGTNALSEALSKAQSEMQNATFNKVNPHFKSKYADLAAIRDATIPALAKNGLSILQGAKPSEGGWVLVTRLTHSSGQWIETDYPLSHLPNDPQKQGSATTYAKRYAWSAICGISADEDDDGNAAQEEARKEPAQPKKATPETKEEPAHVKAAKNIIAKARTITDPDEFMAYADGVLPQIADIEAASKATADHIRKTLGEIEAALKVAA